MQRAKHVIDRLVEAPATSAHPAHPAHTPAKPAVMRPAEPSVGGVITPEFLSYIRGVENQQKVGWDKTRKLWFPHKDPSGGFNIGYGHHFQSDEDYQRYKVHGLSNDGVEKLLVQDILAARKVIHQYIQRRYKVNLQLTPKQEQMLIDYVFNSGGLDKFPKMVDAVLRSDNEKMHKEYKRFATIGGQQRELAGRNQQFVANFMREELSHEDS